MALWPQYLTLAYLLVSAIVGAHKGAQKYSLDANLFGEIIVKGCVLGVLWAGGFFAPLGFAP